MSAASRCALAHSLRRVWPSCARCHHARPRASLRCLYMPVRLLWQFRLVLGASRLSTRTSPACCSCLGVIRRGASSRPTTELETTIPRSLELSFRCVKARHSSMPNEKGRPAADTAPPPASCPPPTHARLSQARKVDTRSYKHRRGRRHHVPGRALTTL